MDPAAAKRFEQLYRDHYDRIWRYVRFKGADLETDDIVTDVFTTALTKLKKIPEDNAGAWLYKVAQNKIMNAIRDKGTQPLVVRPRDGAHDTWLVKDPAIEDPAIGVLENLSFEAVVKSLDDDLDREILYLIGHEGLGPTDIAKILGLKRSAVSMRMQRMRDKLALFGPAAESPADDVNDDEQKDRSAEGRKQ